MIYWLLSRRSTSSESTVPSVAVAGLATDGTNQMARRTATDGTTSPVDASTFVDGMQLVSIIALPIRQGGMVRGVEKKRFFTCYTNPFNSQFFWHCSASIVSSFRQLRSSVTMRLA